MGRASRKIAIVTRTQFTRMALLKRALESIYEFIKSSGPWTEITSYVVTDSVLDPPEWLNDNSVILHYKFESGGDSRYQLVQYSVECIDADFFWFIDDDDWVIPNNSEWLSLVANIVPLKSLIFVDTQAYNEKTKSGEYDDLSSIISIPAVNFEANRFSLSLSGTNHTPFCGVIFPRSSLSRIPRRVYHSVVYFEDYVCLLNALLIQNAFPVVLSKLFGWNFS